MSDPQPPDPQVPDKRRTSPAAIASYAILVLTAALALLWMDTSAQQTFTGAETITSWPTSRLIVLGICMVASAILAWRARADRLRLALCIAVLALSSWTMWNMLTPESANIPRPDKDPTSEKPGCREDRSLCKPL